METFFANLAIRDSNSVAYQRYITSEVLLWVIFLNNQVLLEAAKWRENWT
jgi:hypothetical protein